MDSMKDDYSDASTPRTIHVEPGSEFDRLLGDATETPVEFENRGIRYRVSRVATSAEPDDIWAGYDPGQALKSLQVAAGGWSGLVDAEDFKAYIAERRQTANRPSVKL